MNTPHIHFLLVTFVPLCFLTDISFLTSQIENIFFVLMSVFHVMHDFAFFLHHYLLKDWKPHFSVSLISYFHLHKFSSADEVHAEGFRWSQLCWRTDCCNPIPHVSSFVKWRFIEVLPLRKWWRSSDPAQSHAACLHHISASGEAVLVSCLTSQGRCMEKNNRKAMEI